MYATLPAMVKSGEVNESTIDESLARLFYARMKLGEFDPAPMVPYRDKSKYGLQAFDRNFYGNLSLDLTRQSITLLKNDKDTLPLKRPTTTATGGGGGSGSGSGSGSGHIAVVGIQHAMSAGYNTAPGQNGVTSEKLTALGYNVTFAQGCADSPQCTHYDSQAVLDAVKGASAAVVFIGRGGALEGEGHDNTNMSLPGLQETMVREVMSTEVKTVLVLLNCNPLDLRFAVESDLVPAIVHAYYPQLNGAEAIADVLAGVVSPAGRMPYSWPKDLSQAGDIGNYSMAGTNKTYRYGSHENDLWSFGYGLSYTTFQYADVSVTPAVLATSSCENVTVRVKVTNTGKVDSDEVVQVYASWTLAAHSTSEAHASDDGSTLDDALSSPARQLVAFERVFIRAGETAEVSLAIAPAQMAVLNSTGTYVPPPSSHGDIVPCDGNTTGGTCGLLKHTDFFFDPPVGTKQVRSLDECCAACRATPKDGPTSCSAWTVRGDDASCKTSPQPCSCYLHHNLTGFDSGANGLTSGVVYDRLPPFAPCPPKPPADPKLPVWTLVPATVQLHVGGQQPDVPIAAPSNVLAAQFVLQGAASHPVNECGGRVWRQ
eukprot:g2124.t1